MGKAVAEQGCGDEATSFARSDLAPFCFLKKAILLLDGSGA
jgi:hypothetical protein